MKSKLFYCALLLSLSLHVPPLHGALDDLKNTLGWLIVYIMRMTTVGGAVGGTWFLFTKTYELITPPGKKLPPHPPADEKSRLQALEEYKKHISNPNFLERVEAFESRIKVLEERLQSFQQDLLPRDSFYLRTNTPGTTPQSTSSSTLTTPRDFVDTPRNNLVTPRSLASSAPLMTTPREGSNGDHALQRNSENGNNNS